MTGASAPRELPRAHLVIRGARIVSLDPEIGDGQRGDIEIADGRIVGIGPALGAPGAEVIDGRDRIAIPGFVDPHWHCWTTLMRGLVGDGPRQGYFAWKARLGDRFTPDDTAIGVRLAVADGLRAGITTVHDWAHNVLSAEDAEANLAALDGLGVRARWSYGAPSTTPGMPLDQMALAMAGGAVGVDEEMDVELAASLAKRWTGDDSLLEVGVAVRGPSRSAIDVVAAEFRAARAHGLPIAMHCAGTQAEVALIDQVAVLAQHGLLGPDLLLAHGNHLPSASIERVAAAGIPVTVSPLSELRLGMGIPPVRELREAGVRVSLSLDSTAIAGAADPFAQMRTAVGLENARWSDALALSPREALEMATIEGARSLGLGDRIGTLTPGKRADVVLIATDTAGMAPVSDALVAVVHGARPADVRTVLVDGRRIVDDGRLVVADIERIVADASLAQAALVRRAGVEEGAR